MNTHWFGRIHNPATGAWEEQAAFNPINPTSTGYWRNWYGDAGGIVAQTFIRAVEVSLGLDHVPPDTDVSHLHPRRCWPIEVFWRCPAPWFEGWVTWRRDDADSGHVRRALAHPWPSQESRAATEPDTEPAEQRVPRLQASTGALRRGPWHVGHRAHPTGDGAALRGDEPIATRGDHLGAPDVRAALLQPRRHHHRPTQQTRPAACLTSVGPTPSAAIVNRLWTTKFILDIVRDDIIAGLSAVFAADDERDDSEPIRIADTFHDEEVITNEAVAAVPWVYSCRHTGDFNGLLRTNRPLEIKGVTFVDQPRRSAPPPSLHRLGRCDCATRPLGELAHSRDRGGVHVRQRTLPAPPAS